jgi:hypothetical protein
MNQATEIIFASLEDWLDYLQKDGEIFRAERCMTTGNPISLAELLQDRLASTQPSSRRPDN